jgi:hypothetical protein
MSGHVAKRRRRWPWAILSFLFALAFASSFAVMEERVDDVWSILRIVSAVGLGISLLLLFRAFISTRRFRRAQKDDGRRAEGDEGAETGAEGQQPGEQPPTYEEVFGLEPDLDAGSLPRPPGDEGWPDDDGAEMEADGQPWAEQVPTEEHAPTSDEDVQALHADLDGAVDQVEALDADGESQEHLRRIREQIKARAEEAALRVKQREAELHEAASASDPER